MRRCRCTVIVFIPKPTASFWLTKFSPNFVYIFLVCDRHRHRCGAWLRCVVRTDAQIKFHIWHALFDSGFINPNKSFKMTELELDVAHTITAKPTKLRQIPIERASFCWKITINWLVVDCTGFQHKTNANIPLTELEQTKRKTYARLVRAGRQFHVELVVF